MDWTVRLRQPRDQADAHPDSADSVHLAFLSALTTTSAFVSQTLVPATTAATAPVRFLWRLYFCTFRHAQCTATRPAVCPAQRPFGYDMEAEETDAHRLALRDAARAL